MVWWRHINVWWRRNPCPCLSVLIIQTRSFTFMNWWRYHYINKGLWRELHTRREIRRGGISLCWCRQCCITKEISDLDLFRARLYQYYYSLWWRRPEAVESSESAETIYAFLYKIYGRLETTYFLPSDSQSPSKQLMSSTKYPLANWNHFTVNLPMPFLV